MEGPERVPTPPLPPDTVPLTTQVSGHFYGKKSTKLGMLQLKDGTLVKPIIPPKGDAELRFYREIHDKNQDNPTRIGLRTLIAHFYGVWHTPLHPGVDYLMLENVTHKYQRPCILDAKVGPRTWQPGATEEKRLRELEKYPPQATVGFRLLGIKVYHPSRERYTQLDHYYLRTLEADQVLSKGFMVYMDPSETCKYKYHIVGALLQKLQNIHAWFRVQTLYHFYASSILFVYEGQPPENLESDDDICYEDLVDVRLIDFTHVCAANGKLDENYLTGISKLETHLENAQLELAERIKC